MRFKTIAVTFLTSIVLTACSGGSVDNSNHSRNETQNIKEFDVYIEDTDGKVMIDENATCITTIKLM